MVEGWKRLHYTVQVKEEQDGAIQIERVFNFVPELKLEDFPSYGREEKALCLLSEEFDLSIMRFLKDSPMIIPIARKSFFLGVCFGILINTLVLVLIN